MDQDGRRKRDRFLGFAFAAGELLLEWDTSGAISFAEGASQHLIAAKPMELIGSPWRALFMPKDCAFIAEELALLQPGRRIGAIHARLVNGTAVILNCYRFPTGDRAIHCAVSGAAPADRIMIADRDTETGLMSAAAFSRSAGEQVSNPAYPAGNSQLTVLDVEGLVQWATDLAVEDAKAGTKNRILRDVGGVLLSKSINGLAGRLSPNRFGIIHDAKFPADDITSAVSTTIKKSSHGKLSAHPKASSMPLSQPGLNPKEAMQAMKFALSRLADPAHPPVLPNRLDMAIDAMVESTLDRMTVFQQIIRNGELQLAFQPIVDLRSRNNHHYEALVRLGGPGSSPADSISFAEATGMAPELDLAVWSLALENLASAPPHVRLAINLSGRSMDDTATIRTLFALLNKSPVSKNRILLEVTESAELRDLNEAERTIQSFRKMGVKVCIDDFGAGAASFNYLRALSVDFLKLDGSYVSKIGTSRKTMVLVKALAAVCKELGITSIAEHVETEAQVAILKDMGVDLAQGYLFGRPEVDFGTSKPPQSPASTRTLR